MVIDSKIESFSHIIFQHLYHESKTIPTPEGYEILQTLKNYQNGNSDVSRQEIFTWHYNVLDNYLFVNAVISRQKMFGWHYRKEARLNFENWKNSVANFYSHLCRVFLDFEEFLNPNIFDKMLIVCSYIQEMASLSYMRCNIYLRFPLCFARYVDSFLKDEFYSEGGWDSLMKHTLKYCAISKYIMPLLPKYKLFSKERFFHALITNIKSDCNFEYLLKLLHENALKFKADKIICVKCLSFCDLDSNFIEDLKMSESLTRIEVFLQICLNLMTSTQIRDKMLTADDLNLHDANCKFETSSTDQNQSKRTEPCLKCFYMPRYPPVAHLIFLPFEDSQLICNTHVALEIFKRMFIYNRAQLLEQQDNQNLCACCLQTLQQEIQNSTNEINEMVNLESPPVEQTLEYVFISDPNMDDINVASNEIL